MSIINQALFGYNNGHRLLATSKNLDVTEQRLLEQLSDLSGNVLYSKFDGYLTGYPVDTKKYFVLSKTWYANELSRPGCVWTHALLIPYDISENEFYQIDFEQLFRRPDINVNKMFESYCKPIEIISNCTYNIQSAQRMHQLPRLSKDLLLTVLEESNPLVIQANSTEQFNYAIEYLLKNTGINLFKNISFSTGSFSNRLLNGKSFSLQIAPDSLSKSTWRTDKTTRVISEQDIEAVHKYKISHAEEAMLFLSKAGIYSPNYEEIQTVIDYFYNYDHQKEKAVLTFLERAQTVFTNAYICKFVKILLLGLPLKTQFELSALCEACVAKLPQTNHNVEFFDTDIKTVVKKLVTLDSNRLAFVLDRLLTCEPNGYGEAIIKTTALTIDPNRIFEFVQNRKILNTLVVINPCLAKCEGIWSQPHEVQCDVIKSIKQSEMLDGNSLFSIIRIVLEKSSQNICDQLYNAFSDTVISVLFKLINENTLNEQTNRWLPVCKNNSVQSIEELTKVTDKNLFAAVISVLDPYDNSLDSISLNVWESFYNKYCVNINEDDCIVEAYAQFLLPIILRSQKTYPYNVARFAFFTVHQILAEDRMSYQAWEKLSSLLPTLLWYNMWDKCKRLRKAAKEKKYSIFEE